MGPFVRKPRADYPDRESWMAALDHMSCRQVDGRCEGMHCPGCGRATSGLVACGCGHGDPLAYPIVFHDDSITVNGVTVPGLLANRVTVELVKSPCELYEVEVTFLTEVAPVADPQARHLKVTEQTATRYVIASDVTRDEATDVPRLGE